MSSYEDKLNYILQLNNQQSNEQQIIKDRKKNYDKDRYMQQHGGKCKDDSIECDICGGYWKPDNKWRHLYTKKHQKANAIFITQNYKY